MNKSIYLVITMVFFFGLGANWVIQKANSSHTIPEIKLVPKGWGFEKWIVNSSEYCGKLLYFVKDKRCSWHYHELKDEVFYVQSGKLLVKYAEHDDIKRADDVILNPGDNFHVYRGLRHQMIALLDTELFEFSTQHFEEDSYRIVKGD